MSAISRLHKCRHRDRDKVYAVRSAVDLGGGPETRDSPGRHLRASDAVNRAHKKDGLTIQSFNSVEIRPGTISPDLGVNKNSKRKSLGLVKSTSGDNHEDWYRLTSRAEPSRG